MVQRLGELGKQSAWSADKGLEICMRLVEEQHHLHQGWSVLVANLEDSNSVFSKRVEKFSNYFIRFSERKPKAREFLNALEDDLDLLGQIPLPSSLLPEDQQRAIPGRPNSLLDWISAKDANHSIRDVAEEAQDLLERVGKEGHTLSFISVTLPSYSVSPAKFGDV